MERSCIGCVAATGAWGKVCECWKGFGVCESLVGVRGSIGSLEVSLLSSSSVGGTSWTGAEAAVDIAGTAGGCCAPGRKARTEAIEIEWWGC